MVIPIFKSNIQNFYIKQYKWLEKLNPFHERQDEYEIVVKHIIK